MLFVCRFLFFGGGTKNNNWEEFGATLTSCVVCLIKQMVCSTRPPDDGCLFH